MRARRNGNQTTHRRRSRSCAVSFRARVRRGHTDPARTAEPAPPFEVPEAPQHKGTPLGALLVGRGILSEDQLGEALTAQSSRGERLGDVLVEFGLISERELAGALAEQAGLETIDLSRAQIDPELVGVC